MSCGGGAQQSHLFGEWQQTTATHITFHIHHVSGFSLLEHLYCACSYRNDDENRMYRSALVRTPQPAVEKKESELYEVVRQ